MGKLVKALDTYQRLDLFDKSLGRIPLTGEIFEVSDERLDVLLGNNDYNEVFVEIIEEEKPIIEEPKTEKPVKNSKKKTIR